MHVFFEDDGQLKAGTVLADNDSSLQVEAASGKRLKVKAAAVLLRYAEPSPTALLADAQRQARELDPNFLWEVSGDDEFGFGDLAREYFGHPPAPAEAAAVALALAAAPMFFYKRGKGRYRKAPPDALKAALASVERKEREARADGGLGRRAARAPAARCAAREAADAPLQARQERARMEGARRGVRGGADEPGGAARRSAARSPRRTTTTSTRFSRRRSRRGSAFPRIGRAARRCRTCPQPMSRAFSIDDATTTEIDDAFSVRELPNGHYEVGIHIAAPALGIARGSPLDALARSRLSTVYMPGRKLTMLPDEVVGRVHAGGRTLAAGAVAVREVAPEGALVRHETRVNRVPVAANLRLDAVGEAFAGELPAPSDPPWTAELRVLWKLAQSLSDERGKTDFARDRLQLLRRLGRRRRSGEAGRVRIVPRPRGSPLDKLVAELMIFVNSTLGQAARRCAASPGSTGRRRTAR